MKEIRQGDLIRGTRVQGEEEKNMRSLYCVEGHAGNFHATEKGNSKGPLFRMLLPQSCVYATPKG